MYRFMDEETSNGKAADTPQPSAPDSIISMRNIWKTYQMGVEELHALAGRFIRRQTK